MRHARQVLVMTFGALAAASACAGGPGPATERAAMPASSAAITLAEEAALRHEAAHRSRRILFNNDGGDARVPASPITVEELLAARTTPLIGSQVDTIIYDTTAGSFGSFAHQTDAGEIFLTREGRYQHNITPDLIRQGTDPLRVMLDFARRNGFEFFWTMRMNDTHDAGNPLLLPALKKEHPELLFGTPDHRPPYGQWSGVDYGKQRVRDLALSYIEEVAEGYAVDGIHLDFCRHPVLFKRVAWGEPIRQQELDELTGLMRRIRERLREIGASRGRPILLAIRVPDSVAFCRAIGIDLEQWLAEGLIDLLVPGGYTHLTPWQQTVALGHQYGVPVYPCLSESRVDGRHSDRNALESYRARASNVWRAGADGMCLFNMFDPSDPMLSEIGSVETLHGTDKYYFVSVLGDTGSANPRRFVADRSDFFHTPVLTPASPQVLRQDAPLTLSIEVGDDLRAAVEAGLHPVATLRLIIPGLSDPQEVTARLNGHLLSSGKLSPSGLEYALDPDWLRPGRNELQISAGQVSRASLSLQASAPSTGSRLVITELDVSTPDGRSLRLCATTTATGDAKLGSFSIRTPNKGTVDPVPPGFERASNGYVYPQGWSSPGFFDNGPLDEDPRDDVFCITLPMIDGEPGEYAIQLIAQNRPHPGRYFRDDRIVAFCIDERGEIYLPRSLRDVQLHVRYEH